MLTVLIDAMVHNKRDKLLMSPPLSGMRLWGYLIEELSNLCDRVRIFAHTNDSDVYADLCADGITTELNESWAGTGATLSWFEAFRDIFDCHRIKSGDRSDSILFLSPGKGVICRSRMERILELYSSMPGKIVISAHPLPANCHPAWQREIHPELWDTTSFDSTDNITSFFDRTRYVKPELFQYFPSPSEVKGSQWLPPLYQMDTAIICLNVSIANDADFLSNRENWVIEVYESQEYVKFKLYNLPIFEMEEDTVFEF